MNSPHLELRDGVVWCTTHECPWKQCPCPGQFSVRVKITRQHIDAATASDGKAFARALEASLARELRESDAAMRRMFG